MKKILSIIAISLATQASAQIIYINDSGSSKDTANHFVPKSEKPNYALQRVPLSHIHLTKGLFADRYGLNRQYLIKLEPKKLLQNFYYEAGLAKRSDCILIGKEEQGYESCYWGWESPMCELRGHFLGHYLSACAYIIAETGDEDIRRRADFIVNELAECQKANGGEWVGSIPEKYLTQVMANGRDVWSPQYTLHKTLMGLVDMYTLTGSKQALEIADKMSDWFHRWTGDMIEQGKPYVIYMGETSGMLEEWANLYEITKQQKYLDLMSRYGNPGIFQALVAGEDALSLDHANASIPWSHGSARCYEVTGDEYWKQLTEAFWHCAVDDRESYATGGQNAGEFWIPKGQLANFAGENNQEHCTVYNMMRTADFLYRWTGDPRYADYYERNLYNGVLAQQNPFTGMIAYFLPMAAGYKKGGEKGWGSETKDFFCCHGSLVQAQVRYLEDIYFENKDGLVVSQYIPSTLDWERDGKKIHFSQDFLANQWNKEFDAPRFKMEMKVSAEQPADFALQLRLPWWLSEKAIISVNGEPQKVTSLHGMHTISRTWGKNDVVMVEFPQRIYTEPLPGSDKVAFMEGPIVLAGICDNEVTLESGKNDPAKLLKPEYHQKYVGTRWTQSHYQTCGQPHNIRFVPLYEIADEKYAIYFPIKK